MQPYEYANLNSDFRSDVLCEYFIAITLESDELKSLVELEHASAMSHSKLKTYVEINSNLIVADGLS